MQGHLCFSALSECCEVIIVTTNFVLIMSQELSMCDRTVVPSHWLGEWWSLIVMTNCCVKRFNPTTTLISFVFEYILFSISCLLLSNWFHLAYLADYLCQSSFSCSHPSLLWSDTILSYSIACLLKWLKWSLLGSYFHYINLMYIKGWPSGWFYM